MVIEYFNHIKNHPLLTEHKETATPINEKLNELALAIYTTHYYLQYCKNAFSITAFLQHKLKYVTPKYTLTCYASGNATIKSTLNI
jgi:hypothetical protein